MNFIKLFSFLIVNLNVFRQYLWIINDKKCSAGLIGSKIEQTTKLGLKRVNKNIIIIGDPLETHQRTIRDLSETHRRPTCLIGDPSETSTCFSRDLDMPDWRPIGDLDMFHQRPTCFIGDPLETNMPNRRTTRDRHMPDWRHIIDLDMLHLGPTGMLVSNGSPMGHVGFRWVSNGACRFQMGHQ